MIIVESTLSANAFGQGLETHLLKKLALVDVFVLLTYLVIRFTQLALAGHLHLLFTSGSMSLLFWSEILVGSIIPIALFSQKKIRENPKTLFIGAIFVVGGLMFGRFNVSWLAITHSDPLTYVPSFMSNVDYFPTLPEVAVSFGIVAAGVLAFNLAAKYLPLFEHSEHA
jgi:Ni/Fe-hydrogenase subunit HybB-like protein